MTILNSLASREKIVRPPYSIPSALERIRECPVCKAQLNVEVEGGSGDSVFFLDHFLLPSHFSGARASIKGLDYLHSVTLGLS